MNRIKTNTLRSSFGHRGRRQRPCALNPRCRTRCRRVIHYGPDLKGGTGRKELFRTNRGEVVVVPSAKEDKGISFPRGANASNSRGSEGAITKDNLGRIQKFTRCALENIIR